MHQDIEKLLNAAKEKGSITEKQRDIILNKAQQLGEDIAEVEFVLEDILIKNNEIQTPPSVQMSEKTKSNKMGDVKKCPVCGAIIQGFQAKCPECGYMFENISANNSMKRLLELLQEVDNTTEDNGLLDDKIFSKKKSIIQNFPVPNTKTDIIDFIVALQPKALNVNDRLARSYFIKYQECINKANLLFPNDNDFIPLLAEYKKVQHKAKFSSEVKYSGATRFVGKGCFWYIIISVVLTLLAVLFGVLFDI